MNSLTFSFDALHSLHLNNIISVIGHGHGFDSEGQGRFGCKDLFNAGAEERTGAQDCWKLMSLADSAMGLRWTPPAIM